ncbi:MAG: transposase, partial [Bacteroidales bacterium]|nr:transposase [Bacteroidales bacterium]
MLTLDAQLAPYASSERDLLYKHLEKVKKGDLLLLDRGYASIALIFLLKAKGIKFCMRMKENWWLNVKEFSESGRAQQIVSFRLPQKDRELLKDYPWMFEKEIKCRLVSIALPGGEKEILCTSLMDSRKFPVEDVAELYHFRWNEEEGYKLFKARMEIENFSGKTALAVKQDFFAKVFIMSLCADLAFPIEEKVKKEYEQEKALKHQQKINRTNALSMTREICIGLFLKKLI